VTDNPEQRLVAAVGAVTFLVGFVPMAIGVSEAQRVNAQLWRNGWVRFGSALWLVTAFALIAWTAIWFSDRRRDRRESTRRELEGAAADGADLDEGAQRTAGRAGS
jgi:hypothetical protein